MTLAAECWDILPLRFAEEPFGAAVTGLFLVEGGVIAPVAVLAFQSTDHVVVIGDLLHRAAEALLLQPLVAVDAGMHRRCRRDAEQAKGSQEKESE
jgi:hypothetical protein